MGENEGMVGVKNAVSEMDQSKDNQQSCTKNGEGRKKSEVGEDPAVGEMDVEEMYQSSNAHEKTQLQAVHGESNSWQKEGEIEKMPRFSERAAHEGHSFRGD
ncbi:hypothetical protein QQ045_016711 [Rhodiola kirilowii]